MLVSTRSERIDRQSERLKAAIRARRGIAGIEGVSPETGRVRLEEAARLATVTAHWGIATDIPFITQVVVFTRRSMRLLLRWYINPIVEQQNAYNQSVLNALRDLRAENDSLNEEVVRLREHVQRDDTNGS
jgi:hypothetical protein